jgi:uncharacterized protein (TIGR03437 family)
VRAADQPAVIQQYEESSRYLNAVVLVDDNHGWAVGEPRWDQATHQTKGTIINTTDGGATWNNQEPGVTVSLNGLFFLNASQGWAVGDSGTILRTTDGGAHWTQQPIAASGYFTSVFFTDASNGWATGNAPIAYSNSDRGFVDWQASIWHSTDGGQTWAAQTLPASASLLSRVFFVSARTGFAAGAKRTGYDGFDNPTVVGGIYGTTDGGQTWKEIFATSQGLSFTSVYFTDASNGWAAGFALASDYSDAYAFHTSDGGKTWQEQNLNQGEPFTQVRDLRMLDTNRGYAAGTAYEGYGTAVWRTLDGGATWTGVPMQNTNIFGGDGYYGLAVTADRALTLGDRDISASSSHPWDACDASDNDCYWGLFTQAYLSPHYMFEDVFFLDRNRGWAAGTRTFSPQWWGQEIFGTQDGGQTWTSQFERSLTSGPSSYLRLDSISFADASNGWAAGSSEGFPTPSGYAANLGCILHTADGGKTWTDQGGNICGYNANENRSYSSEYSVIQALDARNVWALATTPHYTGSSNAIQLAHSTDGGNTWAAVDSGIPGLIAVGYGNVQGGMRFVDAQHGCFGGSSVVGCTSDGGAHWTQPALQCASQSCSTDVDAIAFADSAHGWLGGSSLYQSSDGAAHWSASKPANMNGAIEAIQFPSASAGWLDGGSGLLFQTTDAGAHWQSVSTGTDADLLGLSFPDPTHGWMVGDFGTILNYADDRNPAGQPAVLAAVNAASYEYQTSPAAWISIFGANLSSTTRAWATSDFVNGKLPTRLDGVSVLVNGNPAYLSFISPGQINAMFPDDGSAGQVSVQVTNAQGSSGTLPVQKGVYSPALFRLSVEQGNYVIAQTTDGDLVGNFTVGYDLGTPLQVRRAKPGEIVTLYGTGFGPTSPALPSDTAVTGQAQTASAVTFTVGGIATGPCGSCWAGMIGPGLYQFNIQVPPNAPTGDLVIVATVAGNRSQADSVISVGPY